jgi:endonuclease/exonuclease/phosphatase family metal-dependent hydrolase
MYFSRKFVRAMTSTSRSPLNRAFLYLSAFAYVIANVASAQVSMVPGTYSQNFDSLSSSASSPWNNNVTIAGWYSSKSSADSTTYIGSTGTGTAGGLYSFGTAGAHSASDRALGSLASGTTDPVAFGVRFLNDTVAAQTNITVSFTGEQWRNGGSGVAETLAFSYAVGNGPITSTFSSAIWTNFPALNFTSIVVSSTATALDGNNATNRQIFSNITLTGVSVQPGQELFLRWLDANDAGSDDGLAIDDLTVNFQTNAPANPTAPSITTEPQDQTVTAGDTVSFSVVADGTAPLSYQWSSNNVIVPDATNATFTLSNVTTNLNGSTYFVIVTNIVGSTNSQTATLTVTTSSAAVTYLTYNVDGNSVTGTDPTNWAVTAPQVQAIGRELDYLNPDIIGFNEIPTAYKWQMTNWVNTFLPGYFLATNSVGDGFIQNYIASRWPIIRSQSWLSASNLANFGYTNGNASFTRDLFEAQIAVPGFSQPLHIFQAHLKATTSGGQDDADRRAAEASCISNFFAKVFLTGTNKLHPYILSGDLNEDVLRPETGSYVSGQPIQRLTSSPTGLLLTSPINRFTGAPTNDMTESIRASKLTVRFDYIMPNPLMFSNIVSSQIFRTDKLFPVPQNLTSNDDRIASDHLPVMMLFRNPYANPFKLISAIRNDPVLTLNWESVPGQLYAVESSSNLVDWTTFATNLMATNYSSAFSTNTPTATQFFRVRKAP